MALLGSKETSKQRHQLYIMKSHGSAGAYNHELYNCDVVVSACQDVILLELESNGTKTTIENMYATFKNVVNEDFSSYFSNFSNNALVFWGEKDTATSLQSGKKMASLLKKSTFVSYDGDHYFFAHNAKNISERIENGIL